MRTSYYGDHRSAARRLNLGGGGGGAGRSGEYAERTLKHTGFEVPVGYQMEILVGQHLALWEGQQVREWD